MKKLIVVLVCAVFVLAFTSTAVPAAEQGGRIGFGAALIPDYEGSDDMQGWPTVFGRYTWENGIFVDLGSSSDGRAGRAKGNVIQERWVDILKAGPVVQYRFERDDVDDDRVDNMKSVDSAIEIGGFVGLVIERWSVNLTVVTDISDEHDGNLAELTGAYMWPVNDRLDLTFGAGATYADDDYMETYFGVSPVDSIRSGLPVYDADSGIKDVGVNVAAQYSFNERWGMLGALKYNRLLGDAEDSPVVDDVGTENQFFLSVAAVYSF